VLDRRGSVDLQIVNEWQWHASGGRSVFTIGALDGDAKSSGVHGSKSYLHTYVAEPLSSYVSQLHSAQVPRVTSYERPRRAR
jgi:hypothetical protein